MKWQIQIDGPTEDLRSLSASIYEETMRIFEENGGFHLEATALDTLSEPERVKSAAEELLQVLSGAARIALGTTKPINVACVTRIESDGRRSTFVYLSDTVHVRVSATATLRVNEEEIVIFRPADAIPRWIELAKNDTEVAKALRLIGKGMGGWVELYRLFEVIEGDSGGIEGIAAKGWAPKAKLKEFKHTANSPGAVGDSARHGSESTDPPKKPMGLSDARELIMSLMHDWLRGK